MSQPKIVGSLQADHAVSKRDDVAVVHGRKYSIVQWVQQNSDTPVPVVIVDGLHLAIGHPSETEKYLSALRDAEIRVESATNESNGFRLLADSCTREKDAMAHDLAHETSIRLTDAAEMEKLRLKMSDLETILAGERAYHQRVVSEKRAIINNLLIDREKTVRNAVLMARWAKLVILAGIGLLAVGIICNIVSSYDAGIASDSEKEVSSEMPQEEESESPSEAPHEEPETPKENREEKRHKNSGEKIKEKNYKAEKKAAKHKERTSRIHKCVHNTKPMKANR
jgi:hypothetical protein